MKEPALPVLLCLLGALVDSADQGLVLSRQGKVLSHQLVPASLEQATSFYFPPSSPNPGCRYSRPSLEAVFKAFFITLLYHRLYRSEVPEPH